MIVSVRTDLTPATADRVVELGLAGVKVFHLIADQHGRERLEDGRRGATSKTSSATCTADW